MLRILTVIPGVRRLVKYISVYRKIAVIFKGAVMRLKPLTSSKHLSGV